MDSKQSKVQTDRVGKFQRKNCGTGLRFYTGFLSGLGASGVFLQKGFGVFLLPSLLQNFGPFVVC